MDGRLRRSPFSESAYTFGVLILISQFLETITKKDWTNVKRIHKQFFEKRKHKWLQKWDTPWELCFLCKGRFKIAKYLWNRISYNYKINLLYQACTLFFMVWHQLAIHEHGGKVLRNLQKKTAKKKLRMKKFTWNPNFVESYILKSGFTE